MSRVVSPHFWVFTSPTADDEQSLTGLDHELVLNCRGLQRRLKREGERALSVCEGTSVTGEGEGGLGTVS